MKLLLLLPLLMLLSFAPAQAIDRTVSITTLSEFPPNCFFKDKPVRKIEEILPPGQDSSQLQGISWDIVRESFHERGYTIKLLVAPWSRAIFYLESGKVQLMFPVLKSTSREGRYHYSQETVDRTNIRFYIKKNNPHRWNDFKGLSGRRIATVRGWAYGKKWEELSGVIHDPAGSILQGFHMLDNDRVFAVIGYENSFDYRLKKSSIYHNYKKSPILEEAIGDYVIGLKNEISRNLTAEFDRGKQAIIQKGKMNAITQKWFSHNSSQSSKNFY